MILAVLLKKLLVLWIFFSVLQTLRIAANIGISHWNVAFPANEGSLIYGYLYTKANVSPHQENPESGIQQIFAIIIIMYYLYSAFSRMCPNALYMISLYILKRKRNYKTKYKRRVLNIDKNINRLKINNKLI